MDMVIVLQMVIGLAIFFLYFLLDNTTRHQDECSSNQFSSGIGMNELNQCRTRIYQLERDIGIIKLETMSMKYKIDETLGENHSMPKSIVHYFLKYFGLS